MFFLIVEISSNISQRQKAVFFQLDFVLGGKESGAQVNLR